MTLVRDLMQPIYIFGRHAPANRHVTRLDAALERLAAGKNFYLRAGDRLYYANVLAYCSGAISRDQVAQRLMELLPPPEAPGL
jgi:hypothetical protein